VPLEYQADVIRAAISLKLCNFEETGAIIAAHTTSIPEAPGSQRTWDYRYCWLRDAFFVIKALDRLGAMAGALDQDDLDAAVLLLPELGLLPASDERFVRTCDVIGRELKRNGFMMRYVAEDDFGLPETSFLVCQFWYIDALASLGRKDEARGLFTDLLARRNTFGLLSEDIHPMTGELWGNLPQTYSMAGIVNTARILSRSWQEAWASP
jgi:GH15 family glucan-1,4-alpha-glucosidase